MPARLTAVPAATYLPKILAAVEKASPHPLTCPACGGKAKPGKGTRWQCTRSGCRRWGDVMDAWGLAVDHPRLRAPSHAYLTGADFQAAVAELIAILGLQRGRSSKAWTRPKAPSQPKTTEAPPPVEIRHRIKMLGGRAVKVEES